MERYQRPYIGPVEIRDESGRVIPYGRRWEGSPPDESYELLTHPERFAPLHPVADALVDYLIAQYNVAVDHYPLLDSLHQQPAPTVVRAVRLTPLAPQTAPLTFVYSGLPGIHLHAGAVSCWPFPSCGCDACDEVWDEAADQLEEIVRHVVSGRFAERLRHQGSSWWMESTNVFSDGDSWASTQVNRETLADVQRRMAGVPEKWRPWPRL